MPPGETWIQKELIARAIARHRLAIAKAGLADDRSLLAAARRQRSLIAGQPAAPAASRAAS